MDRIGEHLEMVTLSTAAILAGLATLFLYLVPQRHRLESSLATMALTLAVGRLPAIGPAADAAKTCSGFAFFLVAMAASQHPGRRAKLPAVCWGYVLVGLCATVYVLGTLDVRFALVLRGQWLLLAISALLVARTVVDAQSVTRILRGLFMGLSVGCIITFASLVADPGAAFRNGFGRFTPYDCNPNQIGVLFALATSFGLYFFLTTKSPLGKACCLGCVALALSQSILTVSRGSFLVLGLTSLPSLLVLFRRPFFACVGVGVIGTALMYVIGLAESASFERLDTGMESRTATTLAVLTEIQQRPWFGVGFAGGVYAYSGDLNAHNAYVSMLYIGGLSLALPLFLLQLFGHLQMARVWLARRQSPLGPLLCSILLCISVALFAHGFVNDMVYYPTYTWAFLNVFVACLSMVLGRHLDRLRAASRSYRPILRAAPAQPALRPKKWSQPAVPGRSVTPSAGL